MDASTRRVLAAATLALASVGANAALVYGNIAAPPGVYFSHGTVPNGNFWVGTDNGIELGIRARNRQTFALIDGSTGVYHAEAGGFPGGGVKARWNYDFTVNTTGFTGTGPLTYRLGVDHDPSAATSFSYVNPFTYWGDNVIAPAGFTGFENSENVGFADTPGGAFNINQPGLFSFLLEAYDATGALVDSTRMAVLVPEPAPFALLGLALAGLGLSSRRKAKV